MDKELEVKITARSDDLTAEANKAAGSIRGLNASIQQAANRIASEARSIGQSFTNGLRGVETSTDSAGDAVQNMGRRVRTVLNAAKGVAHEFAVGFRQGMQQAINEANEAADKIEKSGKRIHNAQKGGGGSGIGGAIAGLGIGAAAVGAAAGVISTINEYEKLGASLRTITGSQAAANEKMRELTKLAATTPYQLADVTEGFTILKARGLDASIPALTAYGNIASGMGKSLNQMVEAVADAGTGEFERLKEFGINAKVQGDQVALTYAGVTTTVGKNSKEIESYLQGLGNTQFAGSMALQANTLAGAWSNVVDTAATFAAAIGAGGLSGALQGVLKDIGGAAAGSTDLGAAIGQTLGNGITIAWNAIKAFGESLAPAFNQLNTLAPLIQPLVTAFIGLGKSIVSALGPVVKAAIDAIIPAIAKIAPVIAPLVTAVKKLIDQFMATFGPSIISVLKSGIDILANAIKSIAQVVTSVVNAVTALLKGDFVGAFKYAGQAVGQALGGMVQAVSGILAGLGRLFATIGSQIVDGLVQGFVNAKQRAIDAARNLGHDIIQAAKNTLGIASPAKEMIPLGAYTVDGFIVGLDSRQRNLIGAIARITGRVKTDLVDALNGLLDQLQTDQERAAIEYANNWKILEQAHKKGKLTADEYTEALRRLNEQYTATGGVARRADGGIDLGIKTMELPKQEPIRIDELPQIPKFELPSQEEMSKFDQWYANLGENSKRLADSFAPIKQGFSNMISGLITGAQSWKSVMLQTASQIVNNLSQAFVDIAWNWVKQEMFKTQATAAGTAARGGIEAAGAAQSIATSGTVTIADVANNAIRAAAGAYAAIASIPVIGPVLAPITAAAALAGVMALGRSVFSAEGGFGQIPKDGTMVETHKDEMILPAWIANPFRETIRRSGALPSQGMALVSGSYGAASARDSDLKRQNDTTDLLAQVAESGLGGNRNVNISAVDAKSVKKMFEDNRRATQKGLKRLYRDMEL